MITYRSELASSGAGLHALLIGISDYPYLPGGVKSHLSKDYALGMEQLVSPGLSAFRIARWLLGAGSERLPQPLASLRLLIAPSEVERQAMWAVQSASPREQEVLALTANSSANDCTFEKVSAALEQWRDDCASNKENVAWFYFAGHGLQLLPREPVMLLSEYNRRTGAVLDQTIAFQDVFNGMEVTADYRKMARQQHFIVDACRTEHPALERLFDEKPPKPWSYKKARADKREYATVFGTADGKESFGSAEGTVLSQALLRALQGEAADAEQDDASKRIWRVKHYRLLEVLHDLTAQIAGRLGKRQTTDQGPSSSNVIWSTTAQTPILPVSIELHPPSAHPPEALSLQRADADCQRTSVDLAQHPYATQVEAGHYSVSVTFPTGHTYQSYASEYLLYARPPWAAWRIPLAPALPQP